MKRSAQTFFSKIRLKIDFTRVIGILIIHNNIDYICLKSASAERSILNYSDFKTDIQTNFNAFQMEHFLLVSNNESSFEKIFKLR